MALDIYDTPQRPAHAFAPGPAEPAEPAAAPPERTGAQSSIPGDRIKAPAASDRADADAQHAAQSAAAPGAAPDLPESPEARPFIGVLFECCGIYARVYRAAGMPEYRGRCPKCLRAMRVRIGPGGVDARFFRAG